MDNSTSSNNAPSKTFTALKACVYDVPPELSQDHRHLLMVMAMLADGATLRGTHKQSTIAAAMGCSERKVRGLLATLPSTSPIRISRRKRWNKLDGGRTSDEFTLTVTTPLPAQPAANPVEPEGVTGKTEGGKRQEQGGLPAHPAGDLLSICSTSTRREEKAPPVLSVVKNEKANRVAFPDGWWRDREFIATKHGIAFRLPRLVADFEASHARPDLNAFGRYLDDYAAKRGKLPKVHSSHHGLVTAAELAEVEAEAEQLAQERHDRIAAETEIVRPWLEQQTADTIEEYRRNLPGIKSPAVAMANMKRVLWNRAELHEPEAMKAWKKLPTSAKQSIWIGVTEHGLSLADAFERSTENARMLRKVANQ